jgi:hypothetical protein
MEPESCQKKWQTSQASNLSSFKKKLSFYTFLNLLKPIKAVTRHLPSNMPAEEIYEELVVLGFDVISLK